MKVLLPKHDPLTIDRGLILFLVTGDEIAREGLNREMKTISEYLAVSQSDADRDFNIFSSRRSPGTCEWTLNTAQFQKWQDKTLPESGVLWLHANPGTGKSVLSAYLIRHLLDRKAAVQYFFFRFGEQRKRSMGALFASLSIQLARSFPKYRQALIRLKNSGFDPKNSVGWKDSWSEFWKLSLYSLDLGTPIYWVIDGVDEAELPEAVFEALHSINSSVTPIRVLLVSRWTTTLSMNFEKLRSKVPSSIMSVDNSLGDIRAYAEQELSLLGWAQDVTEEVLEKIVKQANGNFLWVHLAMEEIKTCDTLESAETVLHELPDGMEALYARMLAIIRPEQKKRLDTKLQRFLFIWAIYSTTAISLDEMLEALKPEWKQLLNPPHTYSNLCGHFLVIERDNCIRFIHETARDYLKTKSALKDDLEPYQAHYDIFRKSILAFTTSDLLLPQQSDSNNLKAVEYRATSWAYHLSHISIAKHSELALGALVEFFSGTGVFNWIWAVASLKKLNTLIEVSRRLSNFTQRLHQKEGSESSPYPMLADIELLQMWTRDLLKLVAKFGNNLLQQPTAIYDCIPSFCPRGSGLHRASQNTLRPSITVTGQTEDWDDCLSRVSVGSDHQAMMLTCSKDYLAILDTSGSTSIWDCVTFEELHKIPHGEIVDNICFSRSGDLFASYGSDTTKIWNVSSRQLVRCIPNTFEDEPMDFCFAEEDSKLLVALGNHEVIFTPVDGDETSWKSHDVVLDQGEHDFDDVYLTLPTAVSFSPDCSKVAAIYRRFPLTVWSLESQRKPWWLRAKQATGGEPNPGAIFVTHMQWHPNSKDILAILRNGTIVKWDTMEERQQELRAWKASPSIIECSPDGRVFATGDMNGTIKLYDYHTFAQLYQLSAHLQAETLRFSLDSRRFFDLRANYCTVWEPNILVRLSNTDDHLSDAHSESCSIAQSNPHSEGFIDTVAPITALGAVETGKRGLVCVGTSQGELEVHDHLTGAKAGVKRISKYYSTERVRSLTWSGDGSRFAQLEGENLLNIYSVTTSRSDKSTPYWKTKFAKEIKLPFEPGGVEQTLFSPSGLLLLISLPTTVQLWSMTSYEQILTFRLSESTRWVQHPIRRDQVLSVTQTTITAHTWDDLSDCLTWHISTSSTGNKIALSSAKAKISTDDFESDIGKAHEVLDKAVLTHSKAHLILTISRQQYARRSRRYVILDLTPLHSHLRRNSDSTGTILEIPLPESITLKLERPLNILDTDKLIYVDRAFWICSVHLHELLQPPSPSPSHVLSFPKLKLEENLKGTGFSNVAKEPKEVNKEKEGVEVKGQDNDNDQQNETKNDGKSKKLKIPGRRHYFIPRDWITRDTLDLLHLAADGTMVLPRHGEVVVIRSTLR